MRIDNGTKPRQPISAFMNVPTEKYLDVVGSKKENANDLCNGETVSIISSRTVTIGTSCPLAKCILKVSLENTIVGPRRTPTVIIGPAMKKLIFQW